MDNTFLPMSRCEMDEQNIERLDYIVVTPDAYVDHPSFAAAIIGRYVQSLGYRVGVIAQPDWRSADDFLKLGTPKYAFLLSGGNMDGIVGMYTAAKKARHDDAYSPGGKAGLRPPRPTIAYTARLKQAHRDTPVIIGGIEASGRRFAHYDYMEDKVRRSYLVDSKADMLVYGMGEKPLFEICKRLASGEHIGDMTGIRGTCVLRHVTEGIGDFISLPSYERVLESKYDFANACKTIHNNAVSAGKTLVQMHGQRALISFPPSLPLSTPEMDAIYSLPFTRRQHPSYKEPVPALYEVQFGITALRGCPGMCAFCSISAHQGKRIQKRSKKSITHEAERIASMSEFKGNISDVGGPTANFYDAICTAKNADKCTRTCLVPDICRNLKISHKGIAEILESVERVPGVKRVFIRSGLRYDYIMADHDGRFFDRLVKKHVSGQLKVAPEHVSHGVLALMNKPGYRVYENFAKRFAAATQKANKKQYLLPYYISSHPGSTLGDAVDLALKLKKQGFIPEQVQDFYPTPGTLSTCMYHTGTHPLTGKPVYVATTTEEKAMQRALLQFNQRRNWPLIREALKITGREDLIGSERDCLVPPDQSGKAYQRNPRQNKKGTRKR
ncbi:MAG: YgiQ family radical SAM protein [Eubacteriales bacterium]|nr:YgiQ family radical SAM protein [Eubacteriales bacterium]